MAAKANIEKLRLRTAFNSMDYNGLAPSIGARQSSTANNLSYKNSLDSNLSKTSSCDQEFPRKGSSDTIALDGDLFLQSRSGSFTQTRSGSFTQFTQTRSGSFTQRLARSASNASTNLISNIRKRVLATHNFIRVWLMSVTKICMFILLSIYNNNRLQLWSMLLGYTKSAI